MLTLYNSQNISSFHLSDMIVSPIILWHIYIYYLSEQFFSDIAFTQCLYSTVLLAAVIVPKVYSGYVKRMGDICASTEEKQEEDSEAALKFDTKKTEVYNTKLGEVSRTGDSGRRSYPRRHNREAIITPDMNQRHKRNRER